MYYAQIDANGVCYAVIQSVNPVLGEHVIQVDSDAYQGKKYDAATGTWMDMPAPPSVAPAPTMQELKENQLILMDAVATLFETVSGGGA